MRGNMQPASHPHELEATMAELLTSRRFPKQWYQSRGLRPLFALLIVFLGYVSFFVFGLRPPLGLSLVSMLLVVIGVLTDTITTYSVFATKARYDVLGLEFTAKEVNPLLPEVPTAREIFMGKPNYVALGFILMTFFLPLAGWGVAGALFAVSLNNYRNRQQSLYRLDLFDKMRPTD